MCTFVMQRSCRPGHDAFGAAPFVVGAAFALGGEELRALIASGEQQLAEARGRARGLDVDVRRSDVSGREEQ